jgi:WXXGXW repeat (2 copies)
MKTIRLPATIVATSWLATSILTVAWFACPSRQLSAAQATASPPAAAATPSTQATPPTAPTSADVTSQIDPNLQVLTQGAVHEAFGQPVLFNPAPNPVIPKQPPAPVEELPPNIKPAGNNVQWIPGYWTFDAAQQKFVWTSGIWRLIPPGLAWVPGYWRQSGTGYQWVSGYWNRSGAATALASLSKQTGANGLASPLTASSAPPLTANAAAAPNATQNPTLPGETPVANPTNAPGPAPTAASPPATTPPAIPTNSTGAPVATAGTPVAPAGAPAPADTPVVAADVPVAAAAESPILGAVPGPDPTAAGSATADPNPTVAATTPAVPPDSAAATVAGAAPIAAPDDAGAASAAPTDSVAASANGSAFVPQPPASLESGPVGNPPTSDFTWIPGTWIYRHSRFLWLAGQWAPIHRGWVWIPARYVWTPAGYVFVDGYWDYELGGRGVLFAPVSLRRGFHGWGFAYRPNVVLNTDLLTDCLFVNGPCGCYCFGDYYGANCAQAGIFPWFAFHMSSLGYDPCFAYCSWAHHKDAGWHEKLITDFRALRNDEKLRPSHTLDDLRAHRWYPRAEPLALPLSKFVARTGASMRFKNLSGAEQGEIKRSLYRWGEAASKRLEREAKLPKHEELKPINTGSKIADTRSESTIAETKKESKIAENHREGKKDRRDPVSQSADLYMHAPRSALVDRSTTRTPPVVARRPVSTAELGQGGIHETPDQRLANPKFVPQASNRGRSEPAQKSSANRRR